MKQLIALILCASVGLISCSSKKSPTNTDESQENLDNYLPLTEGNTWTYSTSTLQSNGQVDISSVGSSQVSVLKTNTLVGSQPNAFIMHTKNAGGKENNLALYIHERTLYYYIGDNSMLQIPSAPIYWSPGSISGINVGLNQSQKSFITDGTRNTLSFVIKRNPNLSIASSEIIAGDTLKVIGISSGNTSLVLQKVGGLISDTMTVLIEVKMSVRPVSPPYFSWMPVWQLANSTAEEILYSWDTTYTFKRFNDSVLCSDQLIYLITNRFITEDTVNVSGIFINCDKSEMNITVTENVQVRNQVVFNGLSTSYNVTTWTAKGTGFVKGYISGNSLPLSVIVGGAEDTLGILHGYYISPRLQYGVYESNALSYTYFYVNTTPLSPNSSTQVFLLTSENF